MTIMINTLRAFAALLAIFACAAGSGCAELKQLQGGSAFNHYTASLGNSDDNLSPWYFESLSLCRTTEDKVLAYQLPEHEDLWERLRYGFQIHEPINKRTQQELNWYKKHPSYIARVSQRGERYLHYIVEKLHERGMPMELALLPIVESAFDPFAYSHGRASGMWQFIPGTGKSLGLEQNWWYDGRRDVMASTDAAIEYLSRLNRQFDGDWMLALASYNSGAGNVRKAIRKNKKKGKPTDYWSLDLPKETEAYVPRLLAIKELVNFPEKHSAKLYPVKNKPYFRVVDVGSQIDLAQAAEMAELTMDEFYVLNPGFNRWATAPNGPHRLLLPEIKADHFQARLAEIPAERRVTWDRYTIKSGDTLSTIAKRFRTTSEALQSVNDFTGTNIRAGKTLLVPVASAKDAHYAYSLPQRIKRKQSRGKGHKLHYEVQQGDSLWTISRRYKTTPGRLAKWNGMAPGDPIHPGQKLVLWSKTAKDSNQGSGVVRRVAYKVRKGDSLAGIAGKFNVRVSDILQWNQVNPKKYLQPGDGLTLFVDVKRLK